MSTHQHVNTWLHWWAFKHHLCHSRVIQAISVHKGMFTRLHQALATLGAIGACLYLQLRGLEWRSSLNSPVPGMVDPHTHLAPHPLNINRLRGHVRCDVLAVTISRNIRSRLPTRSER